MDNEKIYPIFNDNARILFSKQEEMFKRKRKYKEQYCCSEQEVESFLSIFKSVLENKETMDIDKFKTLFE